MSSNDNDDKLKQVSDAYAKEVNDIVDKVYAQHIENIVGKNKVYSSNDDVDDDKFKQVSDAYKRDINNAKSFFFEKMVERLNEEEEKHRVPSNFELMLNAHRPKLSDTLRESCDAGRRVCNGDDEPPPLIDAPAPYQTPLQIIKSQTKEEREGYIGVLIRMKMNGVDFIDFDGMNCFDCSEEGEKCRGWDGESRRCDCTNRRVDWEYDSDFDEIRAVAY